MAEPAPPAIRLEPLRREHAAALFDGLADPAVYRFLDEDPPPSVDWLADRFDRLAAGAPAGHGELWLNWVIEAEGVPVGTTQATIRERGPTSIAYVLVPTAWGTGIARRAVASMLDVLRREYGVTVVQAEIDPANDRSVRLVRALGFDPDGWHDSDLRFVRRGER